MRRIADLTALPTYRVGLWQAQAFKALQRFLNNELSKYGITPPVWALLGQLQENISGLRIQELSELLGVEPPLVTKQVKDLESSGYIMRVSDVNDRRAQIVSLTAKGRQFVDDVETDLRKQMKVFLQDITDEELLVYVRTISKLAAKLRN